MGGCALLPQPSGAFSFLPERSPSHSVQNGHQLPAFSSAPLIQAFTSAGGLPLAVAPIFGLGISRGVQNCLHMACLAQNKLDIFRSK